MDNKNEVINQIIEKAIELVRNRAKKPEMELVDRTKYLINTYENNVEES